LFLADIIAVWLLAAALTKKRAAAALAALFFAFHTVNAYTTYDLSFAPELVYTLFYIASVVTFLRFLDGGPRSLKFLSLVFFLASLCSKEAAVTLPLALLALALVEGHSLRKVGLELLPYGISVAFYLWFTLSHLGVASEALASLRT